jgi:hypothetical protein
VVFARPPVQSVRALAIVSTPRPPIVGNPAQEMRRAGVAAVRMLVRRRGSFHGWLQGVLLSRHELTSCSCGLINCR